MNLFQYWVTLLKRLNLVFIKNSVKKYLALFFLILMSSTLSHELQADVFPRKVAVGSEKIKKKGEGKLVYRLMFMGFDLYWIGYYQNKSNLFPQVFLIKYLRDIESGDLNKGWEKGLEPVRNQISEEDYNWLLQVTPNVKEGDQLKIVTTNKDVSFYLKGNLIGQRQSESLVKYIFYPWIGDRPVDEELKSKLLP